MTSTKRNTWFLTLFSLVALTFMASAMTASAEAPVASGAQHFRGIKTHGAVNAANGQNMVYHGGPIMANTSMDYLIFWEPPGSKISKRFNGLVTRYFHDVSNSALYYNNSQYNDKSGKPITSAFAAAYVDTAAYPSNYISDKQLQAEITSDMKINGWTASLDNVFFVYTTRNIHICFDNQHRQCSPNVFCAYHSNFGNVIYAAMPDVLCGTPDSPNHDPEADNVIDSTSHEQNEAATDPLGNAWYNPQGNEIGDLCSTSYAPLKYHGGDVFWNNHPYTLQEEWDNAKSKCVIKGP